MRICKFNSKIGYVVLPTTTIIIRIYLILVIKIVFQISVSELEDKQIYKKKDKNLIIIIFRCIAILKFSVIM